MNVKIAEERGFTLIELMTVIAIIGILAAIAIPSYSDFVRQGKLTDATENLSRVALQMEQWYQDNRTYRKSTLTTCGLNNFSTDYFSFTCTSSSATTYLWRASSKAGVGLGAVSDYIYSVDQNNNKLTIKFNGQSYGVGSAGWQMK